MPSHLTSIALLALWIAAPAAAAEPAEGAVALAMREALELHAPLPPQPPELLDLRPAAPPASPRDDARDSALAAAEDVRRAAVERAIDAATAAAREAAAGARGGRPAATGRKVDADADGAVGTGRAAEARGLSVPIPTVPTVPRP